ncbi:hypothetical protein Psed_6804 (plasmid) [Pseudonocardia dioxanivorans CB1190]|uniref:Uncharacterized protein n=1 Tax=Pseudonocardia dioxanivorans (strain ATCC 55486 / DSM 44775 / JCM 13855 / CB1190) TaxID=675635 RepID=F2L6I1_PSEUX|nr:hypothetical protein [Pseudonocardia dioxanivorans]AEA28875.1 hypothetical protein Psed_6804 [Pseudonocardia dioxanivorans CB1190]
MTTALPAFATTPQARRALGRSAYQVRKLIDAKVLPAAVHGRGRGGTLLLDPAALAALAAYPQLPQHLYGPGTEPYALAVGLRPLGPDHDPDNQRAVAGWDAVSPPPASAWLGWWRTGAATADLCAGLALPILGAVSGFVVAARLVTGWTLHPSVPGLIRFETAPLSGDRESSYLHHQYLPTAGSPWELLRRPRAPAPALPAPPGPGTGAGTEEALHDG